MVISFLVQLLIDVPYGFPTLSTVGEVLVLLCLTGSLVRGVKTTPLSMNVFFKPLFNNPLFYHFDLPIAKGEYRLPFVRVSSTLRHPQ